MNYALWEAVSYAFILAGWLLFRLAFKRNVTGDILVGAMLGFFSEFATEPLCDYYFKINVCKDIPLVILLAWGLIYASAVFVSEKLYRAALGEQAVLPHDKRILLFDVLGGALIGFPLEAVGSHIKLWNYRYDLYQWTWGKVPFFQMPYEILVCYMFLMLTGPTIVRYWRGAFGRLAS